MANAPNSGSGAVSIYFPTVFMIIKEMDIAKYLEKTGISIYIKKLKCPGITTANNLMPFVWVFTHVSAYNEVNVMLQIQFCRLFPHLILYGEHFAIWIC